jgi:thioredoxin-like negative regulator of GroEL
MAEYRDKRLAQMREQVSKEKYGTVEEIVKADWTREVNDASQECWVLVHLYQTYAEECGLMGAALDTLAAKFRALKIVKIKSTAAVENFPDKNLPALFMYHEGSMQHQVGAACGAVPNAFWA